MPGGHGSTENRCAQAQSATDNSVPTCTSWAAPVSHSMLLHSETALGAPSVGQFFIAIDPSAYSPGFLARAELMIEAMLAQDGVRLPGDRRHRYRISAKRTGVWSTHTITKN